MKKCVILLVVLILTSCSTVQRLSQEDEETARIVEETLVKGREQSIIEPPIPEPQVPEYVPVQVETSPLKTRTVSIAARNTPLRDVLYTIGETAHLNIVLETGVDPDLPVTMTFADLTVDNALDVLFDAVDYFYTVKDNILIVKAMETDIFELGQPNIIQDYNLEVGGNILSGTSTGGAEAKVITGDVSIKSKSDKSSFEFWNALEKSLETLLATGAGSGERGSQASFVTNRMAGTIMVTAMKKDLMKVRNYLDSLKKVLNRQVLVEARIVEVQLSEGLKYGIDWNAIIKEAGVDRVEIGAKGFTNVIRSGPKFEIVVTDDDFTATLRALQEQGNVKTLSNPRVNIMNGQTSLLSVGTNTTFVSRVETTTTTAAGSSPIVTFTVDTSSVLSGIMFGLAPFIDGNGEITMTITPIISDLVDLESETIGTDDSGIEIKLPTVDLREMSTTVKVLDGQMVIIGGLIDRQDKLKEDKIPILGDLPFIGPAFKSLEKTYENKELVIMLIPKIVG